MHSVDHPHPTRQRGPHNDPSMLDGDSAHGNPGELAGDEWAVDTDTDVDAGSEDELDDAVAEKAPEIDEEADEFEAEYELDTISTGPKAFEDIVEGEEAAEDEPTIEEDVDEADEEAAEEDDNEELVTEPGANATSLEEELDRQMDLTSTDAENPAHRPPPTHQPASPIDGYDSLTIPQVMEQSTGLDVGQLNVVLEYEQANRNRKTLVAKLTKLIRSAT